MEKLIKDTPSSTREGEEIDLGILNDYLLKEAPVIGLVKDVYQFPSGFSNLTYLLRTEERNYVLRRPPRGANIKSAHDMGREFKVLSLLKGNFTKIPKPIYYTENDQVIGSPFYIMERVEGVILRAPTAPKLGISAETYHEISKALIDTLAELHSIDIYKTGLIELGKPAGYISRQVEGWIKRYYNSETDKIEQMDGIAKWLEKNQPSDQAPAFLHNDFKYDNVILNPENITEIIGVLDWEMSTVGDPLMDLGASLAYWNEPQDGDFPKHYNLTWLPGNLTRKEVIERYSAKSGKDLSNILFYYVFGLFKNAVIGQQIYYRWKQGHTKDPRFGQLIYLIKDQGKRTVKAIETGNI
jgi:aminoglycoside phosphotransferase (APT) family kinase protein